MKTNFQTTAIAVLISVLTLTNLQSQTFKTISSGSWTNSTTWENGNIPTTSNDIIIHIQDSHIVTFSENANNHKIGENVHFLIEGELIISGWGNYETGKNTTFDIFGSFSTNHHFRPGSDAIFNIHEGGHYQINGSFATGNDVSFIVNGIVTNQSWSFHGRNDGLIHIGKTGIFYNNTAVIYQNNLSLIIEGSLIHSGNRFQADNNAEITILENGLFEITGYNTVFGNGLDMFIEGILDIHHAFAFGRNGEINLVNNGEIILAEPWMFQPAGNRNNQTIYVCNEAGLPPTINTNQIIVELECGILPVELLYFEGAFVNEEVILTWATAAEINSDYFQIERSFDGYNWEAIAYITSAGNSNEVINYSFNDLHASDGLLYYRLKQIDFDGAFEYFAPIAINVSQTKSFEVASMQKSGENITIYANFEQASQVMVYNVSGQVLASEMILWDTNALTFTVPAQNSIIIINYTTANNAESTSVKYMVK